MASVATQLTRRNLCLAFRLSGATSDSEAWKKMMGDKPVCARLDTLPEAKPRWSALFTSAIVQVVLTAVLIIAPTLFPDQLVNKDAYQAVSIMAPQTEVALPPEETVVRAKLVRTLPPVEEPLQPKLPKLIAPRPSVPAKPKPTLVKTVDVPILNEVSTEVKFEALPSEPDRPREPVKTGALATGGALLATPNKPLEQVQTGGFGEPNGLPGDSNPNKRANIARSGSPGLLPGTGYGNGTGGVNGVRGTVARAGFGDGVGIFPGSSSEGTRGMIKSGGFETAAAGPDVPRPKQADTPPTLQPVVILAKPNPIYSDEARTLGLEGEVLVEVIFPASGPVQVVRVTKGLGHGLDDAAVRAAQQIRFKPALQDGKPVDFAATVHIEFQLAL
jgi:periplasmic protein TonB